jgi:hypothetical protein
MDEHRIGAIRVFNDADGLSILRIADLNTPRHPTQVLNDTWIWVLSSSYCIGGTADGHPRFAANRH